MPTLEEFLMQVLQENRRMRQQITLLQQTNTELRLKMQSELAGLSYVGDVSISASTGVLCDIDPRRIQRSYYGDGMFTAHLLLRDKRR